MPCTYGKCGGNIAADGFGLMISKCKNKADRLYGDPGNTVRHEFKVKKHFIQWKRKP